MNRGQLIIGAAVPTVIALLGAAYVALAYWRASEIVERRLEVDALIERTVTQARAWAAQLAEPHPAALAPITKACAGRIPPGTPASIMAYVAPLPDDLPRAPPGLQSGDDLVGWSTFGPSFIPVDGPIRPELFSRTVLDTLSSPGDWERLVWWRDEANIPFVDQMRWLAVVGVRGVTPEVELEVGVYNLSDKELVCRGTVSAFAKPVPVASAFSSKDEPRLVAFTISPQIAMDNAIRFATLHELCRVGGPTLCRHAAGRF